MSLRAAKLQNSLHSSTMGAETPAAAQDGMRGEREERQRVRKTQRGREDRKKWMVLP